MESACRNFCEFVRLDQYFPYPYVCQFAVHSIWRQLNRRRYGEVAATPSLLTCFLDKQVSNRINSLRGKEDMIRQWRCG
ncbi:hypothetical protein Bca4012_062902 [Brassica carinata]